MIKPVLDASSFLPDFESISVNQAHVYSFDYQEKDLRLPSSSSGWEFARQCRGHGFNPQAGKISHAMGQLSPCATSTEPLCCNYWSLHIWSPRSTTREVSTMRSLHTTSWEKPPLAAARESLQAAVKTQHSQRRQKQRPHHTLISDIIKHIWRWKREGFPATKCWWFLLLQFSTEVWFWDEIFNPHEFLMMPSHKVASHRRRQVYLLPSLCFFLRASRGEDVQLSLVVLGQWVPREFPGVGSGNEMGWQNVRRRACSRGSWGGEKTFWKALGMWRVRHEAESGLCILILN